MWIERKPYWLSDGGVTRFEEKFKAKFMGHWTTRRTLSGQGWHETPVDVFYQAEIDPSRGHTHYFGVFERDGKTWICDASTAFSELITGVLGPDDEVVVSRYCHDYQERFGTADEYTMIDGGRDYVRCSANHRPLIAVNVRGGDFVFLMPPSEEVIYESASVERAA